MHVVEGLDPEQRGEADGVDRHGDRRLGALGEQDQAGAEDERDEERDSCETPRRLGFTFAICSAAASRASLIRSTAASRASVIRSTAASRASVTLLARTHRSHRGPSIQPR